MMLQPWQTPAPLTTPRVPDETAAELAPAVLRPSEYSVALIAAVNGLGRKLVGADVLEIGVGCGVVLGAAAGQGAARLCGVDIEDLALRSTDALLRVLGARERCELLHGHLWQPVAGRRFDLVLANLPQFPIEHGMVAGRLRSWSDGGPDGRRLLDPFLDGLGAHLAEGGRAVITHNLFVDLKQTRRRLARQGLSARVLRRHLLALSEEKLGQMSRAVYGRELGRSLNRIGPHHFAEMHVIKIGAPGRRR